MESLGVYVFQQLSSWDCLISRLSHEYQHLLDKIDQETHTRTNTSASQTPIHFPHHTSCKRYKVDKTRRYNQWIHIKSSASFIKPLSNITYYTNIPPYILAFNTQYRCLLHGFGPTPLFPAPMVWCSTSTTTRAGGTTECCHMRIDVEKAQKPSKHIFQRSGLNDLWSHCKRHNHFLWVHKACITVAPGPSIMYQHYNILKYTYKYNIHIYTYAVNIPAAQVSFHPPCIMQRVQLKSI